MPLAMWARIETKPIAAPEPQVDDLHELIAAMSIPAHVAMITYPRGCRIRRVRVRAVARPRGSGHRQPVILSRRALEENRAADN